MSNSRVIYISNDDKLVAESKSNSNFVCYLKERVSVQQSNYAILKTISLPNVFYNVRSAAYGDNQNDTLVFSEVAPAATFAVSVPEGQYLIADYITALENAMNAVLVSGTVAITQNAVNGKLIFTCTGTQITIFAGDNGNTAYQLIGQPENTNSITSAIVPMPFLPDLSGIQNVYIESRELAPAQGNDPTFGLINIVGQINLSETAFGAYAYYQANDDELATINYKNERNIERIDIRVVDGKGNTLPLGNGRVALSIKYFYD
jgi:hypothetical protein